jgi:hypothetical protein
MNFIHNYPCGCSIKAGFGSCEWIRCPLHAAAEDLLAELREVAELLDDRTGEGEDFDTVLGSQLISVRRAITKATGKEFWEE